MNLFKVNETLTSTNELNNVVNTPLGNVKLDFMIKDSNEVTKHTITTIKLSDTASITRFENNDYEVEMLVNKPFVSGVEECIGVVWRFRLKKAVKKIIFQTLFDKLNSNKVYKGQDHGEELYSLKWVNETHQLHMGTQDNEMLHERIIANDYFPVSSDYLFNPFYEDENGLSIILENVEVGKVGQVHVVLAWAPLREHDISTWFAVDLFTKEIVPDMVEY